MKATHKLHELGQSLWMEGITRDQLNRGLLKQSIGEWSVTGLTSSTTAFEYAIRNTPAYDDTIRKKLKAEIFGEELFFELAVEDLQHAADLFRPVYDRTDGVDGWVSLVSSPLLTSDPAGTITAVMDLHRRVRRPNVLITIPGLTECLPVIEEAIFTGVPVNITLLFSPEHYLASAEAYLRGIERRIAAGLRPYVCSVASISVSQWDAAVAGKVPDTLHNQLGNAVARRTYKACREVQGNPRWERAYNAGARPQRLLWAGTGKTTPNTPDMYYVNSLAAPFTIHALSESILRTLADTDNIVAVMPVDGGDCEAVLARFAHAGIDIDALACTLQNETAKSSVKSWIDLRSVIASKSAALIRDNFEHTVEG